jgi:hypothetical protein
VKDCAKVLVTEEERQRLKEFVDIRLKYMYDYKPVFVTKRWCWLFKWDVLVKPDDVPTGLRISDYDGTRGKIYTTYRMDSIITLYNLIANNDEVYLSEDLVVLYDKYARV